jgi:hypothetical protein
MKQFILLFLASLAMAKANSVPEDAFVIGKKSLLIQNSPDQNPVCPSFADGIFILVQPVTLAQAANACLQNGLGLANLTFANNLVAAQLLNLCGSGTGWLSSFEQVRSDTCVVLTNQGNVFYPDSNSCGTALNVPICQNFASTLVSTSTTTLSFCSKSTSTVTNSVQGTVLTTVTSTIISTNPGENDTTGCAGINCIKTCVATLTPPISTVIVTVTSGVTTVALKAVSDSGDYVPIVSQIEKITLSTLVRPTTVTFIPPVQVSVCPQDAPSCGSHVGIGEFVLIKSYIPFSQAVCACKQVGMQVAAISDENLLDATNALFRCGGAFSSAWVQSINGNDHQGLCLALNVNEAGPGGNINYPGGCNNGLPVLCQKRPSNQPNNSGKPYQQKTIPRPGKFVESQPELSRKKSPRSYLKNPSQFAQFQAPVYSLCSTTQNNLFIVSSQAFLPNQNYAAACGQFNLVPANIYSSNRGAAGVIFGICSTGDPNAISAIINSFEAIEGSVCDLVDDVGAILVVDSGAGSMATQCLTQRYFVCQATNVPTQPASTIFTGPFVIQTTTTVSATTISTQGTTTTVTLSGTTTSTTTEIAFVSLTVTTAVTTTISTIRITTGQIFTVTETDVSTVTPVVPTCPLILLEKAPEHKGFIVLTDKAPYWEAECACRAYGLKLAELDMSNFADATESIQKALGIAQRAWIKKYSGEVFGKQCMALYTKNTKEIGGSVLPMYCDAPVPIICQKP